MVVLVLSRGRRFGKLLLRNTEVMPLPVWVGACFRVCVTVSPGCALQFRGANSVPKVVQFWRFVSVGHCRLLTGLASICYSNTATESLHDSLPVRPSRKRCIIDTVQDGLTYPSSKYLSPRPPAHMKHPRCP